MFHSINLYSQSLGIDSLQVVFAKDSTTSYEISKVFGFNTPEMIVFDKKGCEDNFGFVSNGNIDWDFLKNLLLDPNKVLRFRFKLV